MTAIDYGAFEGHTPGPWRVMTNRHNECNGDQWGTVEWRPHPCGGAGSSPAGTRVTWSGDVGRRNAALIAAAPDLLARCKVLEEALREIQRIAGIAHPIEVQSAMLFSVWAMARTALAPNKETT